jgi:hypothetical protein
LFRLPACWASGPPAESQEPWRSPDGCRNSR